MKQRSKIWKESRQPFRGYSSEMTPGYIGRGDPNIVEHRFSDFEVVEKEFEKSLQSDGREFRFE